MVQFYAEAAPYFTYMNYSINYVNKSHTNLCVYLVMYPL